MDFFHDFRGDFGDFFRVFEVAFRDFFRRDGGGGAKIGGNYAVFVQIAVSLQVVTNR